MSKSVDQKVVEMKFDNRQFESNVQKTMSTLDKLKQSLNFKGASQGLENVNAAASKCDMSLMSKGVETVQAKFSALQVMAVTALGNITNSAVNAGKRIVSALTIDPIKTGFEEYETQINAVQTILANTSGKGTTLKQVNDALDELNLYADKTIYNFTEMTRNIGTFTAAGVDLKTSTSAIQGIANLAAVSGSNSQQASTAMYQLSQALAAGTVKLMDWNSVVNAGMGGEVFQNALKETAKTHGVEVDKMIKKEGSFRETLQKGWLTSDVLTETLSKFTKSGVAEYLSKLTGVSQEQIETMQKQVDANKDGSASYDKLAEKMAKSGKIKKSEALELLKMADTAEDAATKVKTFTQLWDTLKEAAQSGWTQSWEIIVGDFEEAKELLTEVSDVVSNMINESANARNELLQGWKDLGGRTDLIDALKNAFEGVMSVIKPIKEAFREVFPPITAKQLAAFTKGLKDLTSKLILSDEVSENLKATFKGIFLVFRNAINLITKIILLVPRFIEIAVKLRDQILAVTGTFGGLIDKFNDAINIESFVNNVFDTINNVIGSIIDKISNSLHPLELFNSILEKIRETVSNFINNIGGLSFDNLIKIFNAASLGGITAVILKFSKGFGKSGSMFDTITSFFKDIKKSFGSIKEVTGILDGVKDCLAEYQNSLKAETLKKIATAIAILAASLLVISLIDSDKLASSLAGISALFAELSITMYAFTKIGEQKGVIRSVSLMIGMSAAILILSASLKVVSSIDFNAMLGGLVGIAGLMGAMIATVKILGNGSKVMAKGVTQLILMATALKIMASVCKDLAALSWEELARGLTGVGALLAEIGVFAKAVGSQKSFVSTSVSLIALSVAIKLFASSVIALSSLSWEQLAKGLVGMAGSLLAISMAMRMMPKNMAATGIGLIIVAAALNVLANALGSMGSMSWESIAKGMVALGGSLLILAVGLHAMSGTALASASLLIAAAALSVLTSVLSKIGSMSWESIAKGLIALAGAFAVIGIAAYALTGAIPAILALSAAFALIGVGAVAVGVGLSAIAVGLTALATAVATSAGAIVAGITLIGVGLATAIIQFCKTILDGISTIAAAFKAMVLTLVDVLVECIPAIADGALKLVVGVMAALVTYTPQIVNLLFDFIIGLINGIAERVPDLIKAIVNLVKSIFEGSISALGSIDFETLVKGVECIGLLTGIMIALGATVALIPSAMVGVVGLGVVITELAAVLAAVGGLAQIPGLTWLVNEGGNFLEAIGTAIGQFVGGIVGGVAKGITSALPEIATDLSNFMTNVQPFVDGIKSVDSSALLGAKSLAAMILAVTASSLLERITSFITGGNSLSNFSEELIVFGKNFATFADSIAGIDDDAVKATANAAKSLSELANGLPNEGGLVSIFAGDNTLASFAEQLVPFGTAMKSYSEAVAGLDTGAVTASTVAAQSLSELANGLPNTGGLVSLFAGDNSLTSFAEQLAPFGAGMKAYSEAINGIDAAAITNSATAAQSLVELSNKLPNTGGLASFFTGEQSLTSFAEQLVPFGTAMKEYSETINGMNPATVEASASAANSLAELANNLPKEGGFLSLFTGEGSLTSFATSLKPLGTAMREYSEEVSGIDDKAVVSSANAAKSISELAANLPKEGGFLSIFTGEGSLASFTNSLKPLGTAMREYSAEVTGIDAKAVTSSANAAKTISELANNLPKEGGFTSAFTGEGSLTSFAQSLIPFGKAMKEYGNSVAGIKPEAVTASANAAKTLAEAANNIPKTGGLVSSVTGENDIAIFAQKLVPFGTAMKAYGNSVAGIKPAAVTASANAVKMLSEVITNTPKTSGNIDALSFANQIVPFGKAIKQYSNQVAKINVSQVSTATNALKKIVEAVKNTSGINASGMQSLNQSLSSVSKSSVNNFINAFKGANTKAFTAGKELSSNVVKGAKSGASSLTKIGSTLTSTMLKGVKSKNSEFNSAGKKLVSELKKGLDTDKKNISTVFTKAVSDAVDAIRKKHSSFNSAGKYLGEGLVEGINAKQNAAYWAGYRLGQKAVQGEKDGQKSKSPSKLTIQAGKWLGEGLVIGMQKMDRSVYKAGYGMGETATKTISDAVSHIASIVDSDMDTQPTIRPVLDLSDVESGASSIGDMLGVNPSIGVLANAGSISSMMNSIQNGPNDDVVSAINDLKSAIGNLPGDTYNVNGVTYDDGSNIANAVQSLVRATRVERRI